MKISKLFHWLYAFVMFLPIFAIGGTLLISTFNMSAKEESEIHYKYETNEVNSSEDLIEGNIYSFNCNNLECHDFLLEPNSYICFKLLSELEINTNYLNFDEGFSDIGNFDKDTILTIDNYSYIYTFFSIEQTNSYDNCITYTYYEKFLSNCVIELISFSGIDYTTLSLTDYNEIESVETHNLDTQEVFYRAVDKVTTSPLFSWAYDSFLVAPFSYIVVLFGMPTTHVVVELLSYWLAISIIWLVFDLIMYVPLLVHRWLDKGVLE